MPVSNNPTNTPARHWRIIAAELGQEKDHQKVLILCDELARAFDQQLNGPKPRGVVPSRKTAYPATA
jgi:hypothetical protein